MPICHVDPALISNKLTCKFLRGLFDQYKTEQVFSKRKVYNLYMDSSHFEIRLTKTVLRSSDTSENTFYILSNQALSHDDFSTVYPIDKELYLPHEYEDAYCKPHTFKCVAVYLPMSNVMELHITKDSLERSETPPTARSSSVSFFESRVHPAPASPASLSEDEEPALNTIRIKPSPEDFSEVNGRGGRFGCVIS